MLKLDVGHFFADKVTTDGVLTPEAMVRNKWVVEGYQQIAHDAANLSYRDLAYAEWLFAPERYRAWLDRYPVLEGFISANVRAVDSRWAAPAPYIIKLLRGDRFPPGERGERLWRVGIVGVTDPPPQRTHPSAAFRVDDPLVASRRAILEARAQCDFLIVLAYVSEETAFKLLDLNPEIDVVIAPRARWRRRYRGEHGSLVYADPQTKQLGELRIYLDEAGRVVKMRNRYIMLDRHIPDDPDIEDLVDAARQEIAAAVKAWLRRKRRQR
ncbi:MAG: hypothetical protein D6723_19840 [Acidobacteria bacterium]|nr:MAG: hypothetical protein D6723_19840 [Acidobacteriota bacterium]